LASPEHQFSEAGPPHGRPVLAKRLRCVAHPRGGCDFQAFSRTSAASHNHSRH
jgi:hypothetical protein